MPSDQVVFLLEYIGSDYALAVEGGRVVNAFEYAEMLDFTKVVAEEYAAVRPGGEGELPLRLTQLGELVRRKSPAHEVRALVGAVVPMLAEALGVSSWPDRTPDVARGRALYAGDCGPCHGSAGRGDGWAAPGLDPPPTSFHEPRMEGVSPHQISGAIRYGIPGTAMPSYGHARGVDEIWDLAFFVASLGRAGSVVRPADGGNAGEAPAAESAGINLAGARDLERAFTSVAERVFPSVVGVTALAADDAGSAPDVGRPTKSGGWSRARGVRARNPGFAPVGAGSGFFVANDGTLLTDLHFLVDPATGRPAERIEVEFGDDRRGLARVLGVEPMINLAVLKVGLPIETPVAPVGDSAGARVGQWVIALGDPPGVERTFVAGSLSATPRRECYQEEPAETLFQTSIWIEAGGFGGPVVDLAGRVIGVAQPKPGVEPQAGMPSALRVLPIELALTIYEALATEASEISPWLGFAILELSRDLRRRITKAPRTGVYIDDVFDPSPASRAGIRAGDVLTSMNGNRLLSVADFQRWLYLSGVGATVTLELYRDGRLIEKQVPIEQRPAHLVP